MACDNTTQLNISVPNLRFPRQVSVILINPPMPNERGNMWELIIVEADDKHIRPYEGRQSGPKPVSLREWRF